MPRVVHVVATTGFAGVERYVCDVARETVARGWETTVVGGDDSRMRSALEPDVRWRPGASAARAALSLGGLPRQDICHAHMTVAETVALLTRPFHRAPVVSTRHFAARRGSSRVGRVVAPWIGRRLAREIAVSDYVASHLERAPDAVIRNGVPPSALLWSPGNRVVLVLQRLESEKDTWTALRAWGLSRLAHEGWTLRVVGDGSERAALQRFAATERLPRVEFADWTSDVASEYTRTGILLATAPAEPFGLTVVEAMAAGVPVVASAAGGHLETVGRLENPTLFPPGDAAAVADALRSLRADEQRRAVSDAGRALASTSFSIPEHVDLLLAEYAASGAPATGGRASPGAATR